MAHAGDAGDLVDAAAVVGRTLDVADAVKGSLGRRESRIDYL
jgi:hypothetical protein